MGSAATTYVRGIHEKFDFYAAWPPNQMRKLGDIGRLTGGQFERLTSLADLKIVFAERVGPVGTDLSHTSGSSVAVQMKAKGETLPGASIPNAQAGASIEFSASGAFVFQALAPVVREIEDQVSLATSILEMFRARKNGKRGWNEDWCVVTELMSADKVTVLISNSKSSRIELSVDGSMPVGPAPLASVGAGLGIVSQKGEVTSVLAASGLTPLFRVARVRRSILDRVLGDDSSADLVRATRGGAAGAPRRVFEPVPLEDALKPPAATARPPRHKKAPKKPPAKRKASKAKRPSRARR